jgi:putative transposase
MPRRLRKTLQGTVFHVMNRAVRRNVLFECPRDYDAFVDIVVQGLRQSNVKIIAYCLMPNHWHFVVICERIAHLSKWMHWVESTHANRWNGAHGTRGTGAVYQDRFKAVPVQKNRSVVRVCRYVERNALRSGLVGSSELWRWSSLYATCNNCVVIPLDEWPIPRPDNWREVVNLPETPAEFDDLRRMIRRNQPIGSPAWQEAVAPFIGQSMRGKGRPKTAQRKMDPTP